MQLTLDESKTRPWIISCLEEICDIINSGRRKKSKKFGEQRERETERERERRRRRRREMGERVEEEENNGRKEKKKEPLEVFLRTRPHSTVEHRAAYWRVRGMEWIHGRLRNPSTK